MNQDYTFSCLSSYLVVNFLNTLQMHHEKPTDLVDTSKNLNNWLDFMVKNNILEKEQQKAFDSTLFDIENLQSFRGYCRNFLYQTKRSNKNEFLEWLSEKSQIAPLYFMTRNHKIVPIPKDQGSDGLISLLVFDLLRMQENGDINKIKKCANNECLAFFVNQKGNQKWCSMEICGNRTKVKRHYYKTTK